MRAFIFSFVFLATVAGCSTEQPTATPEAPLNYVSKNAPYSVVLPAAWRVVQPDALNSFADLAANYADTLYVIVIPQKLPTIPGIEPPDALALKRASLAVLEEKLRGFTVERQGPIKLGDELAQSVFAHGESEGQKIQYVATYVTRGEWGFQIVGWGPVEKAAVLTVEIDRMLTSWKFTSPKPAAAAPTVDTTENPANPATPPVAETDDVPDASND